MKQVTVMLSQEEGLQIKFDGINSLIEVIGLLELAKSAVVNKEEDKTDESDVQ